MAGGARDGGMPHVLALGCDGETVQHFPLGDRPLEVGSSRYCDIVVHDRSLPLRAYLVEPHAGVARLRRVGGGPARVLPLDEPVPVGRRYTLTRRSAKAERGATEPIGIRPLEERRWRLLVGSERRYVLRRPLTFGSGVDADVRVGDASVSQLHCRFAPSGGGALVRDLGSRNGTWMGGRRVHLIEVGDAVSLRVGRTELRLVPDTSPSGDLIVASRAMATLLSEVRRLAALSFPVLIEGESGVGKEGIAREFHRRSPRSAGPFVAVNAGGLPPGLVESELFGHEQGAFTGATRTRLGAFEQAAGGTLFLDEIGELPLGLQARLLRVLEGWEVRRVGGERVIPVDVRLVCATHRDLRSMVSCGTFREDLLYRVLQLAVRVPPLRERPQDVVALAHHFLHRGGFAGVRDIDEAAMTRLSSHDWPGNARELRNVVRMAAAATDGPTLEREQVELAMARLCQRREEAKLNYPAILDAHGGNLTAAARSLGVPRSTFRDRLRRHRACSEVLAKIGVP